jgi:cytochrome c peroxidase
MNGGADLKSQGIRAVPSLMYLERQPPFSVGPDDPESEGAPPAASGAANVVPQGGLFWDGRADTLQSQAIEPLLNPREMDARSVGAVAAALRRAPYAPQMQQLFGPAIFANAQFAVSEALFAVARYQIEDPSFHPYSSKYDAWLEGKAQLSAAELRGYRLFNDPNGANCAACHLDKPSPEGLPPLFTDHQYEALGVPRNPALALNRNPDYADLGICGPVRRDMTTQKAFCGMFATPTLRNVATRHAFFHNGVYHTLAQVLDFYVYRDTQPQRIFPRGAGGRIEKFNDLPAVYRGNVDVVDAPFGRGPGAAPVLTPAEERDVIAFLRTLTDGYLGNER